MTRPNLVLQTKSAPKAKSTEKKEKVYISIDLPPQQRDREFRGGRGGPRGGRGGDRGGRGRGGDRGGRGGGRGRGGDGWGNNNGRGASQANVDVDDQSAFPSLS